MSSPLGRTRSRLRTFFAALRSVAGERGQASDERVHVEHDEIGAR